MSILFSFPTSRRKRTHFCFGHVRTHFHLSGSRSFDGFSPTLFNLEFQAELVRLRKASCSSSSPLGRHCLTRTKSSAARLCTCVRPFLGEVVRACPGVKRARNEREGERERARTSAGKGTPKCGLGRETRWPGANGRQRAAEWK